MRDARVVAFERAVLALLSLPAGCAAGEVLPSGDAGAPNVQAPTPGMDAGTAVVAPGPTSAPPGRAPQSGPDAATPSLPTTSTDAGKNDLSPPVDAGWPSLETDAACDWLAPNAPETAGCSWFANFLGNAIGCAGFTNAGSSAQCAAICGPNANGELADTCTVTDPSNPGLFVSGSGGYRLDCQVTKGSCAAPPMPQIDASQFMVPPGNGGRRPGYFASLGFGLMPAGREVGTHFARVACMEAGSVEAFRQLRDELRAHGAPEHLVRGASRAMRDEIRHVRQTSALARRFGERPLAPLPTPPRLPRTFEDVALENAIEGCVRETYSALECMWQAESASDPVVRSVMARIARDEMRHLALSWEVHGWAKGRLGRAALARVLDAQLAEVASLADELAMDPIASLVGVAGLPRAAQSRSLCDAIASQLRAA